MCDPTIDGTLKADWPSTLTLAKLADEMEFEALVPVARWKGFGGVTNFNGPGFETYSWAAGIGASTKYSAVFATSHVPTVHPIMAAKQATTIDHITGGRFALNVVTGWHRPEIEMFGIPLLEHDARYEVAVEWLDINQASSLFSFVLYTTIALRRPSRNSNEKEREVLCPDDRVACEPSGTLWTLRKVTYSLRIRILFHGSGSVPAPGVRK